MECWIYMKKNIKTDNCHIGQCANSTNTVLQWQLHSISLDYVYHFAIWNKVRSHPLLLLKIFTKAVSDAVGSKHMREHRYMLMSHRWIHYMAGWNFSKHYFHIFIFDEKTSFGVISQKTWKLKEWKWYFGYNVGIKT